MATKRKKKIRVGLIRCDMHGIYYATLFAKHDPERLRSKTLFEKGRRFYSWQTGGAHFYHYTHYADPHKMTAPHVSGMELVKLWEANEGVGEIAASLFKSGPKVCKSFEEVSDDVDMVLVADCNFDGSDHLKLATPGIRKRVPTFIDKPFANEPKDAVALVKLAKKYRTPILSLSILRSVPQGAMFRDRFQEVGGASLSLIHI